MPKVSKAQAALHRAAIVRAASRLFRERGLDRVGVAEITQAAGLTHGGFYGHFASKEALAGEAVTAAFAEGRDRLEQHGLERWVRSYLSRGHRDRPDEGCPLLAFHARSGPGERDVDAALARGAADLLAAIAARLPTIEGEAADARDRRTAAVMAAAIGGQVLARALVAADPALSDAVLAGARDLVGDLARHPAPTREIVAPAKG